MKKRGTVARCCCGGGGVGQCPDACVSNWNNCPQSNTGAIFSARSLAYDNCGWLYQTGLANVAGVDGTFSVISNGQATLRRFFSFDYRTTLTSSIEFQSTVEEGSSLSVSGFGSSLIVEHAKIFGQSTIASGSQSDIANDTVIIQVDATLGSVQSSRRDFATVYDRATDSDVLQDSCLEAVVITLDIYVDSILFETTQSLLEFAGIRCYTFWDLNVSSQNFIGPSTANMTIS